MDLTSILPLLMHKDGDKTQLLSALMPKNEKTGDLMKLMSMMDNRPKPAGLAAIKEIAPNEFLGALLKYFSRS